jgi:cell division protein FtsZ
MAINLRAPELKELKPRITVLGVGGAGGNAVNNMINAKLDGVTFAVANTDAQALAQSKADIKIQLGAKLTEGLGAGAKPEVGRGAAEETIDEIMETLKGSHMVFITAGMGGGTGTGAAPVIARAAREQKILTVGVVTKPFHFEGDKRMRHAERGIEELQEHVDTLIVIPNQNLFRVATERTTFAQAFAMADDVLHSGVRGITNLIIIPGLINRDFADVRTVMSEMGKAMMGTGEMEGEGRALRAAETAISNPLLDDVSMRGARAVLINVTGGPDMMLLEVDEAVNRIRKEVDPDASIVFGSALSESMEGRIRVSVVATGIDAEEVRKPAEKNVVMWPKKAEGSVLRTGTDPAPMASPVHSQRDNIEQVLGSHAEATIEEAAMVEAGDAIEEEAFEIAEPLDLGGMEMPPIEAPQPFEVPMYEVARPEKIKRRLFGGIFKRILDERVEPRIEKAAQSQPQPQPPQQRSARSEMAAPQRPARTETIASPAEPQAKPRAKAQQAQSPQPGAHQSAAISPRAAAEGLRQTKTQPGDDLFNGVTADDKFEIPAFLRRQANTGT